ncbi:MAG: DUF4124 domain-containing protein [Pseudomonadota bacterium]
MKLLLAAFSVLLASYSVASAEVYKWVDADGKTHYSDSPPPKQQTEKVKIQKASTPAPYRTSSGSTDFSESAAKTEEPRQVSERATCSKAFRNLRRFAPAWERKIRAKMPRMTPERRAEAEESIRKMKQGVAELPSEMGQCVSEMSDPSSRRKTQCMANASDDTMAMFCVL